MGSQKDTPSARCGIVSCRSAGQALVEFALILPILLLLTVGLIDAARAILAYNSVSNAAREGARFGIVLRESTWGDENLTKNGNAKDTYTPDKIALCLIDGESNTIVDRIMLRTPALDPANTTITINHGILREGWPAAVEVKVTQQFKPIVLAALGIDGFDLSFTGASEMIIE